jgi:predicted nucleotidyltransferase/uncharacterized protein YutE (UPF0331/DUF86 family)
MTDLAAVAATLQVSDRTLRRAAGRGTIRCTRRSERRIELPIREQLYLESHWPLIQALLAGLRTLPTVRLAVLYGSAARGDDTERSDLDLLVRLAEDRLASRAQVVGRLEDVAGRTIQLVGAGEANALLLNDVLRDGRVLVDRDREWAKLLGRRDEISIAAANEHATLEREVFDDQVAPIPAPMLVRLRGILTDIKVLKLLLDEVTLDEYREGLTSKDPVTLRQSIYPLERAFEVASNYTAELIRLGLDELGVSSIDGQRDIGAFVSERIISAKMGEELVTIHRGRNMLAHAYPDLKASVVYDGATACVKLLPRFVQDYIKWLDSIGYATP